MPHPPPTPLSHCLTASPSSAAHSLTLSLSYCLTVSLAYCFTAFQPLTSAQPSGANRTPFRHLRARPLEYNGPSTDLTHLASFPIAWFGPSDPTHPLTGDIWLAANLALNETAHPSPNTASPKPSAAFALLPCWSADPWRAGVTELIHTIYTQSPLAILGSVDSASTHLAEQIAAKANLPLLSPFATDPSATLAGVAWMFSCAPSDAAIAKPLVQSICQTLDSIPPSAAAKFALVTTTDHDSRMFTREILKTCSQHGFLPDFQFDLPPHLTGLNPLTTKFKAAQPALALIVADPEDSARIVAALRQHIPSTRLFGTHVCARNLFRQRAGPAVAGLRYPILFDPTNGNPKTSQFVARFNALYGHHPDFTAALTYDATQLLLAAIHRVGPNRNRIRQALLDLAPWQGVAGPIRFDGTGQNTRTNITIGSY